MNFKNPLMLATASLLSVAFLGAADAGSRYERSKNTIVHTRTVTTHTVTTRTITKKSKRYASVKKRKYVAKRPSKYVAKHRALKVRKVKVRHPRNFRHHHLGHDFGVHSHQNGHVVHRHGRHNYHSHGQRDFITIHPSQKSWLKGHSNLSIFPAFPWANDVDARAPTELALVVVEQKGSVNIIRNVKTFTGKPTQEVLEKSTIGSSAIARPTKILRPEEIAACNRRLKILSAADSVTMIRGGVGYCQ